MKHGTATLRNRNLWIEHDKPANATYVRSGYSAVVESPLSQDIGLMEKDRGTEGRGCAA